MNCTERARHASDKVVVFPELSLSGYMHRDSVERDDFLLQGEHYLQKIVTQIPSDMYVIVGVPMRNPDNPDQLYNACVVIHGGRILHWQAKTALPSYDIFDEQRYYTASTRWETFSIEGLRCGIVICEDAWQAEPYSGDQLRERGFGGCALPLDELDLLVVCSASPYENGKFSRRVALLQKCCTTFEFDAVYVNSVGAEDGVIFDGRSFALSRTGELRQLLPMCEESQGSVSFPAPTTHALSMPTEEQTAERYTALVFGVREYVRKNGFQRVVLGLSGGIDSALTAAISAAALGPNNVQLLVMPSHYSSQSSVDDALALINRLATPHTILPIAEIFAEYIALLRPHLYSGNNVDITEQNLQARIRGMLVMAYSNTLNALPLATGNKSELAVGYCTQYGDMVGALAVIGDLYKSEVYELARYINRDRELIPLSTIKKPPSAELKPQQTDQDTLPPYDVLDRVLRLYIEEHSSLAQITALGVDEQVARDIIQMHHRSEHKRAQAPPVIRVSKKAFGIGRKVLISRAAFELS